MIVCEVCGGTLKKLNSVFVCNSCGLEYSVEDVKKMAGSTTLNATGAPTPFPSVENGAQSKERENLISFLSAMFDAVFSAECCDEQARLLEGYKRMYIEKHQYVQHPFTAAYPVLDTSAIEYEISELERTIHIIEENIAYAKKGVAANLFSDSFKYSLSVAIISAKSSKECLPQWERKLPEDRQKLQIAQKKLQDAKAKYQTDCANYRNAEEQFTLREAQRRNLIEEENAAIVRSYDQSISDVNKQKEEFLNIASSINAKNILYSGYMNSVAIMQLREYLIMGICTQLEGPQGAYSFYLNELRANRICGTIHELQQAMISGMNAILANMRTMQQQLDILNHNISSLRSVLSDSMSTISSQFARYEENVEHNNFEMMSKLDGLRKTLDDNCGSIRETVQKSAYNQYLQMQRERLQDYSYGRPYTILYRP